MAKKLKFADGTEAAYLCAVETEEFWGGASRRTVSFEMEKGALGLESLDALCSEQNCAALQLVNEGESVTGILEGYVLKLKLAVEPVLIDAETQTYAERVKLKLGKRTYIEQQLHELGLM